MPSTTRDISTCVIVGTLAASASAQTFDHDRTNPITVVGTGGELLVPAPPGSPAIGLAAGLLGLGPGDDIDAVSFGNDAEIAGFHLLVFSVSPPGPLSFTSGSGVGNENGVGTAPSFPGGGAAPPEAAGDLFMQSVDAFGTCTNVLAPAGLGYQAGTLTGDESNATWMTPNMGLADDLDAFEYSPPFTAGTTGVYFSLAPGSPTLLANGWTPGDILYAPLNGTVQLAQLAGIGAATDANLGIGGQNLNALNCVASAPGVIAAGAVGPTPCSVGGGSHLLEFSVSGVFSLFIPGPPPSVVTVHPSDILGVAGVGAPTFLTAGASFGLCTSANCSTSDNVNALEVVPMATAGTTFDYNHTNAATASGAAGDLFGEGTPPGSPLVTIPRLMLGLQPGDDIDAVSYGDEPGLAGFHKLIFSVSLAQGLPGSGVDFEQTVGTAPMIPSPPEAAGDLFLQVAPPPLGVGNVLAPAGMGYAAGTGTGDEFNATFFPPGVGPPGFDDLDAFDYSPAAVGMTTGIYFSLSATSTSVLNGTYTAGDILYSPMNGTPPVLAILAGVGPATDAMLGIPGEDLDALNMIAGAPGVIAAGAVGPTPGSAGGGTHLLEFSVSVYSPWTFNPADIIGFNGPGTAIVLTPWTALGLCGVGGGPLCGINQDGVSDVNALEDPTDLMPICGVGFGDTFEGFEPDTDLHDQFGWKGWDNDPAFSAPVVQDQARSGSRSVRIDGDADLVHEHCVELDPDAGVEFGNWWSYEAWQYIPSDFESGSDVLNSGTWFILLNTYEDGGPYDWSVQMRFDSNDGLLGVFHGEGSDTVDVPYETDRWVRIQTIVDLDEDWTRVYYDDELVTEYPWTGGAFGGGGGALDIAAVDLYAFGSSPVYYDDLLLQPISGCGDALDSDADGDGRDLLTEFLDGTDACVPDDPPVDCPADITGDGSVNVEDLVEVILSWGACDVPCPADLNGDLVVDVQDLVEVILTWGDC